MKELLGENEIRSALEQLPGWAWTEDALQKTFVFNDFKEALSFIVRLGLYAEEQQHHPELFNTYRTVRVALRTHSAGNKVTGKDVALARAIEGFNWIG